MPNINNYLSDLKKLVKEIDVQSSYKKQKNNALLIDIREKDEVNSGSPKEAIRITKGHLEMQISKIAPNVDYELHLICASGRRSLFAAYSLQQMGYTNVYSVAGGYKEWKNQSLPFEIPVSLKKDDYERYMRHLLIDEVGEKGQLTLLKSKVLIVGAGGIGSPTAWYLAAAGIGTLGILDDDVVDKTNLQRQILHTESSVGTLKVDSAKERLEALNNDIEIVTFKERLTKKNAEEILRGFDIVIDGTDNFTTRYLINDVCVKLKIPNIHGSVFQFEGQFSTFWPSSPTHRNTPCYRCLYPLPPPPELAPSCAEAGVLGVLPGMVGVLCATEAIKILIGFGELMIGKLFVYNASNWEFDTYEIEKDDTCPYCNCSEESKYPEYSDYTEFCSI